MTVTVVCECVMPKTEFDGLPVIEVPDSEEITVAVKPADMLHPQASKEEPWFWTITAQRQPPSPENHGYSDTREAAMLAFKARLFDRW